MKQTRSAILYDDNRSIDIRYCCCCCCYCCWMSHFSWAFYVLAWWSDVLNANDELNIVINRNLINCQRFWFCCTATADDVADTVRYLYFIYLYNSFCIWKRYSLFAASFLIISFMAASWKRCACAVHGASEIRINAKDAMTSRPKFIFIFIWYYLSFCPHVSFRTMHVFHFHLPFFASRANTETLNMHYKQQQH